jgi:DNA-directed RNA polymerase
MTHKEIRKLIKTPAMAFAYSISRRGIVNNLVEVYFEKKTDRPKPPESAWGYLADTITAVCQQTLRGPSELMLYIIDLAKHCAARGDFLELTTLTGFPFSNEYRESDVRPVYLMEGGCNVEFRVANGTTREIDYAGLMGGACPNFIHALDATHLIQSVNAATIDKDPIRNILTVHDCFAVAAPDVERFLQILKRELCIMYVGEPLKRLHARNGFDGFREPPPYGDLDPFEVQTAEYCWI